jgi:hypothetical protein
VWAKQFENAGTGFSIVVSPASQELYISGCYTATADFDPEAGVYALTSNGAADMYITKLHDAFVGIDEQTAASYNVNVYPNPASETFYLAFTAPEKGTYGVKLFNMMGQLLYNDVVADFTGTYSKQFNATAYKKGIYTVCISNKKNRVIKKLIVN